MLKQRAAAPIPEGLARSPSYGGLRQHLAQLGGELRGEDPTPGTLERQGQLSPLGVGDPPDPAGFHPPAIDQRRSETHGMEGSDARAPQSGAQSTEGIGIVTGIGDHALGVSGAGDVEPPEAIDGAEQGVSAHGVYRQLREALVVGGDERPPQGDRVSAMGGIDPPWGQTVLVAHIVTGAGDRFRRAVESRGHGDHLDE